MQIYFFFASKREENFDSSKKEYNLIGESKNSEFMSVPMTKFKK